MSRIQKKFAELKKRGEAALIPFVTAGDPDLQRRLKIMRALEKGGADCIELGIPFSDPTRRWTDDSTLVRARFEKAGALPAIFRLVREFRRSSAAAGDSVRLLQSVFSLRSGKILPAQAAGAGADGVLCVDLPPEESGELKRWTDAVGMDLIFLLSPTSGADRVKLVARQGRGFIYYVSVTGVTGARRSFDDSLRAPGGAGAPSRFACRWASVSAFRRRSRRPGSPALPTRRWSAARWWR